MEGLDEEGKMDAASMAAAAAAAAGGDGGGDQVGGDKKKSAAKLCPLPLFPPNRRPGVYFSFPSPSPTSINRCRVIAPKSMPPLFLFPLRSV